MTYINTRNDLIETLQKNLVICEVGVFKGEFSKFIFESNKPKELHLIDPFEGLLDSGDKDGNNVIFTNLGNEYESLKNHFKDNRNVIFHKGYSQKILEGFQDSYLDAIYIDGDHSYEGVKNDLKLSYHKVKNLGIISGHDFSIRFKGVMDAVEEFCREYSQEIKVLTKDSLPSYLIELKK
jgi:Methyltransferase domain